MSQQLRDELERIAGRAPVVDVPADTWTRARRSVRRDTVAVLATVAVVVALVAGAVTWLPDREGVAPADGDGGALPAYLPVPVGIERVPGTDDLAVGVQAVAMVPDTPQGKREVVVVDARSGEYRGLDLPGFGAATGRDLTGTVHPVALSPTGMTMVYPRASGWRSGGTLRTGIGVVDLVTGDVRKVALVDDGRPVLLRSVSFSPDGRWVLWSGQPVLGGGGSYGDETAGGLVAPGSSRSIPLPGRSGLPLAVDDAGTIARIGNRTTRLLPSGTAAGSVTLPGTGGIVLSGTLGERALSSLTNTYRPGDDPQSTLEWMTATRAEDDAGPRRLSTPAALGDADWRVLEWIDPDHAVVAADVPDAEGSTGETELGVVALTDEGADYEPVATSDPGHLPGTITVATDLLADGAPVVERPLPAFAEQRRSHTWWYVGGVLLGLGALALVVAGVRRRRTSAQRRSAR